MILDLRKILRSGENSEDFFFLYEPENELSSIPEVKVVSPVKIIGTATLTGNHTCLVEGEIVFSLKGECTRCLKEAERGYIASFSEEVTGAVDSYPVVNDTVDLRKIAEDTILMNMPLAFLCKDDCKGLCASCGKDLNEGKCDCN